MEFSSFQSEARPLISIIIPVYNSELYLERCLYSVVSQTYSNLEIIVVDDGSTDSSPSICDGFAAKDHRIKVIHKKNNGVASARNTGLANAAGSYIGWLDSDDYIEPDMFEYLLENMLRYASDISVCGRIEKYSDRCRERGFSEDKLLHGDDALMLLVEDKSIGSYLWDKLYKAELFDGIEFPAGHTFEDTYVLHRVFSRAKNVICLKESKYVYLQHSDSIVGRQQLRERIDRFRADTHRFADLSVAYPDLASIQEAKCIEAAVNVWNSYCSSSKADRKKYRSELDHIAAFSRQHWRSAIKSMGLGITGRLAVPLTQYNCRLAFFLAYLLYACHKFKHAKERTY